MNRLAAWKQKLRSLAPGAPRDLLVNLGCGAHFHPAWTNLDGTPRSPEVRQVDLRKPLPFFDEQCAVVYSSHVLEHFSKSEAPAFLRECLRVLRAGGILRLVVPDLEMIARLYLKALDAALQGDADAAERHEWMTLELLDQMVRERSGGEMLRFWMQQPMPAEDFVIQRMGSEVKQFLDHHRQQQPAPLPFPELPTPSPEEFLAFRSTGEVHKWMYDRLSLRQLLLTTGFSNVRVCTARESSIAGFASYYLDELPDGSIRKPDSLFMEAVKPGTAGS